MLDPSSRPLLITIDIPIKTYDIDFASIVSNIVYLRWLEDLRIKLLEEHFPSLYQQQQTIFPILSETQITYKRPIRLFDQVTGQLWMRHLTRIKWTVQAEILCNREVATLATQTGAFVDSKRIRPVPIPSFMSQKFFEQQ
ncbi:MAG: acyl-CoA thioesterase [Stenomitos rutilans HA7619-LM2]|nr:acyl-CoA thioesterase [Stenomitos rutilans HA7619-LM2]